MYVSERKVCCLSLQAIGRPGELHLQTSYGDTKHNKNKGGLTAEFRSYNEL